MRASADDIIENLKALGYGGKHYTKEAGGDGSDVNRIYLQTGSKHSKAYLDLTGENPVFRVWVDFPEGHRPGNGAGEPLHGTDLKRHNLSIAEKLRADLRAPVVAAVMVAESGGDLGALAEGFGLVNSDKRYAPYEPKAEKEAAADAAPAAPAKQAPAPDDDIAF